MEIIKNTPFTRIYDAFLAKVTDDMYMEFTELDTFRMLQELLISAIFKFEFPRVNLNDYETFSFMDESIYKGEESNQEEVKAYLYNDGYFNALLTQEEINILAAYMVVEWLGQQLASVENTRMKYSGSDFKFTSQANHIAKLKVLKEHYTQEGFHLQRLYKRRKINDEGVICSTLDMIMKPFDGREN